MKRTIIEISGMDCPAEEALVRTHLESLPGVHLLRCDLPARRVEVVHEGEAAAVLQAVAALRLGAKLIDIVEYGEPMEARLAMERRTLWQVLGINAGFFGLEALYGLLAGSMGLLADSLDMLADALVYGLSLAAVHATAARKRALARGSGYIQMALAFLGLGEVIRRVVGGSEPPEYGTMIVISALALVGNSICLVLLQRTQSRDVHIRASMIFTSNDVIINLGVIVAGTLVYALKSALPDLVVGAIVFVIVMRGALRILRLGRSEAEGR